MSAPSHQVSYHESDDQPVACFYEQHPSLTVRLREYFSSYGCVVHTSCESSPYCSYVILCGDPGFVKSIFSNTTHAEKMLCVFQTDEPLSEDEVAPFTTGHTVIINLHQMSQSDVQNICQFYFSQPPGVLFLQGADISKPKETVNNTEHILPPKEDHAYHTVKRHDEHRLPHEHHINIEGDKTRIQKTIEEVYQPYDVKHSQIQKKYRKRQFFTPQGLGLLLVSILPLWYICCVVLSTAFFYASVVTLKKGEMRQSRLYVSVSSNWLKQGVVLYKLLFAPLRFLSLDAMADNQEQILMLLEDLLDSQSHIVSLASTGQTFTRSILGSLSDETHTASVAPYIDTLKTEIPYINDRLGLVEAQVSRMVKEQSFPFAISRVRLKAADALSSLSEIREDITFLSQMVSVFPTLAGFHGKKTYLLLLQNSAELRPTGGFIGTIATLAISEGIVEALTIQDVYTVDGQLKGHVDPPHPIRELLGQEHWYLRDSGWNPDFPEAAKTAAWFYEKETGMTVDGVIAINTPFIIDILRITGPIELSDYNDRISADNFFGKSLYYVQERFFPGSTQKKDFIGALVQSIFLSLTHNRSVNGLLLAQSLHNAFIRRDIQMYVVDNDAGQLIDRFGWSGRASPRLCQQKEIPQLCVGHSLVLSEANVSMSKINYLLQRFQDVTITFAPNGDVSQDVGVRFVNSASGNEAHIGSTYRTYLRYFLEDNESFIHTQLDGQSIPFRSPSVGSVLPYAEFTGSVLGMALDVPEQSERTVRVRSTLGSVPNNAPFVYEFFINKHPGVSDTELMFTFKYPTGWKIVPLVIPPGVGLLEKPSALTYNTTVTRDQLVRVFISPNTK